MEKIQQYLARVAHYLSHGRAIAPKLVVILVLAFIFVAAGIDHPQASGSQ